MIGYTVGDVQSPRTTRGDARTPILWGNNMPRKSKDQEEARQMAELNRQAGPEELSDLRRSATAVRIYGTTYAFDEASGQFKRLPCNVAEFLARYPVGTVYRESVGAPGTGHIDYRVTSHTESDVFGVKIRDTTRILSPEEVR